MRMRYLVVFATLLAGSLAAHADTFNFALDGGASGLTGSAVITATQVGTSGTYLVTDISGNGITGPIGVGQFANNDNLFFPGTATLFDAQGLSFYDQNISGVFEVRLYSNGTNDYAQYSEIFTTGSSSGTLPVNVSASAITPEPSSLVLLGTGVLGALGAARRRWSA